jgi:hypothetical protein
LEIRGLTQAGSITVGHPRSQRVAVMPVTRVKE